MLKLLVIADDFTGALDTGVQFSKQGAKTFVSTEITVLDEKFSEEIEVLVLNTESRHLSFDKAYESTKKIIKEAKKRKIPYIYKKVDSALRGNISAEIKAVLEASGERVLPFLPAYPEMKRVLIEGTLYIEGVPVSESVFAKDPYEPVVESNVILRLEQEAQLMAKLIKEKEDLAEASGVLVFDTTEDEILKEQGKWLEEKECLSVSAGCAGFAKVLAQQLFPNRLPISYDLKSPLVVICGSVNPITKKQVAYVEKKHHPRISLSASQLLDLDYWESSFGEQEVENYLRLIKEQEIVVFETWSDQTTADILAYSKKHQLNTKEYRFRIGESLGKLTQALWQEDYPSTFLFTGGDTLFQSMEVLGIKGIKPLVEINPGVVLSTIEWQGKERQVITKSGGFGSEKLFEEISQLTINFKEEEHVNGL